MGAYLAEEVVLEGGALVLANARLWDAAVGRATPLRQAAEVGVVGGVDVVDREHLVRVG